MSPQQDPRVRELNDSSNTWLIITIVGWFMGFVFLIAPFLWIKGSRLRAEYRSLGMPPSGGATGIYIIGIICSLLDLVGLLSILSCVFLFAGAAATGSVH